jgi:hypothetical protein
VSTIDWPSKDHAERWEISRFLDHYRRLPGARSFEIVEKSERPDWILRDVASSELLGVELTAAYLDNRSVPDFHQRTGTLEIPYRPETIADYGERVAAVVEKKIRLARSGYRVGLPLILSIYANEYVTLHMAEHHWNDVVRRHEELFDAMNPFIEVVVWPLVNDGILRVRPS